MTDNNSAIEMEMHEKEVDELEKYPVIDAHATFSGEEMDKLTIAFKSMIMKHTPLQELDRLPEFSDIMQGLFERCNLANKRFNPQHHVERAMSGEYTDQKREKVEQQWTEDRENMISRARLAWCKRNAERWLTNEAARNIRIMNERPTESFEHLLETSSLDYWLSKTIGASEGEDSLIEKLDDHMSLQQPYNETEALSDFKKLTNLYSRKRDEKGSELFNSLPVARKEQLRYYLKMAR